MSTEDARGQPLVFKAALFQMRDNLLLVEFRRSKVCIHSVCACVRACVHVSVHVSEVVMYQVMTYCTQHRLQHSDLQ